MKLSSTGQFVRWRACCALGLAYLAVFGVTLPAISPGADKTGGAATKEKSAKAPAAKKQSKDKAASATDNAAEIDKRIAESAKFLSSDELEGRGLGTKQLDLAAEYLAGQFKQLGLKTELFDGTPFQKLNVVVSTKIGPRNSLAFTGPAEQGSADAKPRRTELKLGDDFNPLSLGGSQKFDLPLVFAGYGITDAKDGYDDYAGIDVRGKAVIVLRHRPQQGNPHSVFGGANETLYAPFSRKVSNAYEHGAAAIIFCSDQFDIDTSVAQFEKRWQTALDQLSEENTKFTALKKPSKEARQTHHEAAQKLVDEIQTVEKQLAAARDLLLPFEGAGTDADSRNFPVLFCRRAAIAPVIQAACGVSLAEIEKKIDAGPASQSRALAGWAAQGETSVERQEASVKNVVAVLEGEGPKADETIVIGAHYDHLGWGGRDSAAPGVHEIHNGADDNASGTAVLLEVARELAARPKKLPRRIVFIAFTGEERGLLGSAYYVRHPLVPIENTVAMLNMDMVGRLKDEKLIVYGTGTAPEFDALIDALGKQHEFHVKKDPGGFGPSDHSSFYGKHVPVLHFFTGSHSDYHRPSDHFDKLNIEGMRRVGALVAECAVKLAEADERPLYHETEAPAIGGGGDRPYFGSVPDFGQEEPGYALSGVTKGSPADRGGLRAGDIIVQLGDSKIGNLEDFDSALRKHKAGEKVPVTVKRDAKEVKLQVVLEPPK